MVVQKANALRLNSKKPIRFGKLQHSQLQARVEARTLHYRSRVRLVDIEWPPRGFPTLPDNLAFCFSNLNCLFFGINIMKGEYRRANGVVSIQKFLRILVYFTMRIAYAMPENSQLLSPKAVKIGSPDMLVHGGPENTIYRNKPSKNL